MQYSQEHLKTMVYAEFGGQTECIMGNSKIENDDWRSLTVGVRCERDDCVVELNPVSINIYIQILPTDLHTFPCRM